MYRRKLLTSGGSVLSILIAGCTFGDNGRSDLGEGSTDDTGNGNNGDGIDEDNESPKEGGSDSSSDDDFVEILEHEWYSVDAEDAGVSDRLENVSGEEIHLVTIKVHFVGDEGTQITEGQDSTSNLESNHVWEFDVPYPADDPERVDTYDIESDVSVY
ncbi:FxLYD domain-containing protein [Natronosalvus caseinilyticus]|uniref:FxLYD domain-containing protein n=1 Tax=Natronosalvus caseinilyticus TaxID=2953747 RepID=UPI0028A9E956|nr:FxLYD domain-containing protein [Natronosalvus caseinilyticus]